MASVTLKLLDPQSGGDADLDVDLAQLVSAVLPSCSDGIAG